VGTLIKNYHNTHFAFDQKREVLWQTLCKYYFQKLVPPEACVLDIGSGYGNFINNIRCRRRIAVDRWPGFLELLDPGVEGLVSPVTDLAGIQNESVDFAFASNMFEHLTRPEAEVALAQLREKLKPSGTLNILQLNFRFAYREYFDDYTHISVYSDRSLCNLLRTHGFEILECHPRFLPLTLASRFPVVPVLIRGYLWSPVKPLGKQMFIRAVKG
jgi:SAM-dependent methyltransferase